LPKYTSVKATVPAKPVPTIVTTSPGLADNGVIDVMLGAALAAIQVNRNAKMQKLCLSIDFLIE
jgi:hypothetical protein